MILYFDSYITDTPLNKNFVDPIKWVREAAAAYTMPSKIDIAKYTLASYASYPWSHVLIRFELEDTSRTEEFEAYVRDLFPTATILRTRSANQAEYRTSLEIMNEWDDDWVWYAPNNDHPIVTHDVSIIDTVLAKAQSFTSSYPHISIMYSHLSEFMNQPRHGTPFWKQFGQDTTVIDEDADTISYTQLHGDNTAVQIVNKNLLTYWFNSHELGDARIIRSEDVRKFFYTKNQLIIVPKREIAAHFDGYSHTMKGLAEIAPEQIPPLCIPAGFFNHAIKIKYGFQSYDKNYTNINPSARQYVFENNTTGTDIKTSLQTLPLFWKHRISELVTSPTLSVHQETAGMQKQNAILTNPYALSNKPLNVSTLTYIVRLIRYERYPKLQRLLTQKMRGVRRKIARLLKQHPTSHPYLSGDTFRAIANHVHDMDSTVTPASVHKNDIVFVQSHLLRDYFSAIHPHITEPYILISHNADENITAEFTPFISKTIIHWFAQNCVIVHPKVTPLPIGLENKWYHLHGIPAFFDRLRSLVVQKRTAVLYKFSIKTNVAERTLATTSLEQAPNAETYADWRESYQYLSSLQNVKFVASPAGNGEDCIRTWEAMYLKTVPILRRSVFATYFEGLGLPIMIIENWAELTELDHKRLDTIYDTMADKWDAPALWADYWITQINSKKI